MNTYLSDRKKGNTADFDRPNLFITSNKYNIVVNLEKIRHSIYSIGTTNIILTDFCMNVLKSRSLLVSLQAENS